MKVGAQKRPYRQVARAQAQQRTRAALISAAEREFFAGRWENASLEAIAASVGTTKQTLLRHLGRLPRGRGRRARQLHYDWGEHAFGSSLDRFNAKLDAVVGPR